MSKNIVYQTKKTSGGQEQSVVAYARKINKIQTNSATWVPEDKVQKIVPKSITQDGTYEASKESGSPYGYSEVMVQGIGTKVMGDLGTITIAKNGTFYADRTYTASELGFSDSATDSDGNEKKYGPFYGYRTIIVNVPSGKSSSGSSSSGKSKTGVATGGALVNISVNSDGQLVTKKVATSIVITGKPKYTTYRNGDVIDFSGLSVTAYAGSEVHGEVPPIQLMFPTIYASGGGGQSMNVPVQWNRPEDGQTLETSFSIKVNDAKG